MLSSYPKCGTRTSMLQDFERGKRLGVDVLNGALIELGKRHGLPTPVNEQVVNMLNERVRDVLSSVQKSLDETGNPPADAIVARIRRFVRQDRPMPKVLVHVLAY